MTSEIITNWFKETGLTEGIENLKKFEEEVIKPNFIEKEVVRKAIMRLPDDNRRHILLKELFGVK